jgi:uncharacterized membrane protein YkgB
MKMPEFYNQMDVKIAAWMQLNSNRLLRFSMGIIFIWFGALKFAGISPANELVTRTVYWFRPEIFIPILGWWVIIGICMIVKPLNRAAIFLLFLQMPGTVLPLFILPDVCFTQIPFGLTLEGQYIIKNLVLISAAIAIGAEVRTKKV